MKKIYVVTTSLLLGAAVYSVYAQEKAQAATAVVKPALSVSLVKPAQQQVIQSVSANGVVAAWQEASVSAEVSGLRLVDIEAQVGDVVKKGQVLARFAQDTLNAEIAATKAQLAEAQASADEAKANAQRARALEKEGFYSSQAISQASAQEKGALARLDAAKANLALQELRLKHSVLIAPDAGVIISRNAAVGSVVAAGTELFRMNRQSRLEWRAELTPAELGSIKRGSSVVVDADKTKVKGIVRQIAPNLESQTRQAIVYVDLPMGVNLRVGQFVKGEFSGNTMVALTVPVTSVVMRDGFNYVFVVNGNKASQVKVVLGQRQGSTVVVTSGLKADQAVVATGAAFLTDADTVKVVQP